MRIVFFLTLLLGLSNSVFAQNCTVKGLLQDENGLPINDATVSIFNANNEGVGFTYSDLEGEFSLEVPCNEKYEIEIEHSGFEQVVQALDLSKNQNLKLKLKATQAIALQEAIVNAKQAIKVKGDTIEYDADSFKVGNEEVLEDILKKLPGIVVENGKVYHNGKEITTITVGGREVLGGNTKLLNKNLPSDAVDKIQLNKKFKANPFASSLQQDEQMSLNIELKEDKKNLAFGNITIGGDADKHANVQSKTFYFSEKTDATLIGDFNTYGKQVFDQEDYMSFFGVFSDFNSEGSVLSLRTANNPFSFLSTQDQARELNTFTSAAHMGYQANKNLMVTGFGMLATNNIRYNQLTERFHNASINNRIDRDEESNKQNVLSGMGRLRLDYSPSDRSQIKYRLNFNYTENNLEQNLSSYQNNDFSASRNVENKRTNNNITQNFSYIKKVGKDDNLGLYFRHQYQEEKPNLMIRSSDEFLSNLYPYSLNSIEQQLKTNVNTLQLYAVYNHLLSYTANLKLKAGTNFSNQKNTTSTFGQEEFLVGDLYSGRADMDFQQFYISASIKKKFGKFLMDVGTGVHHLYQNIDFLNERREEKETKFFPFANFEYNFSNSHQLSLDYRRNYSYPSISDLNPLMKMNSYFSVFYGNRDLHASSQHDMNLRYYYFNSFSFFNIYAQVGYTIRDNSIQTMSNFLTYVSPNDPEDVQFNQSNTLINSPKNEKTFSANLNIGKRFSKIYRARINGNFSNMDYYTFVNNEPTNTRTISHFYTLDNIFTIKKKVEFTAGLKWMQNDYRSLTEQSFESWVPNGNIAWTFLDKWLLQSDINYHLQYQNGEKINEAKELNASLRYNLAKKTYVTFIAGNILGNDLLVSNSFNDNYTQTTQREVLGRYFLVNLRYKF